MKTNNKKLIAKIEKIKNRTLYGRSTPVEVEKEVIEEAVEVVIENVGEDDKPKRKRAKQKPTESVQDEPRPDEVDTDETIRET